jgi:anti-sigma factor RsiW
MTHEISCKELVDLVTGYMDETISDEARAKFEQHLSECGYCSAYVQQMNMTVKLTSTLSETEPPKPAPDELLNIFRKWKQENKPD